MKHKLPLTLACSILALSASGQDLSTDLSAPASALPSGTTNSLTNGLPPLRQPVPRARRAPRPATNVVSLPPWLTNGLPPEPAHRGIAPVREIQPVPGGAVASFGRLKVNFASDAAAPQPITMVTPDGKALGCRATMLALRDTSGQGGSVLLGEVTNCQAYITGPCEVIYSNAFDTIRAHIRYEYHGGTNGHGLTQDVILEEQPFLPESFNPETTVLEVWTEWFGAEPVSVKSRSIARRPAGTNSAAPLAADAMVDFGVARMTGLGRAFSLQAPTSSVPVTKTWGRAGADGDPLAGQYLVESVDYLSLKPQFDLLPQPSSPGSASLLNRRHNSLLASLEPQNSGTTLSSPLSHPLSSSLSSPVPLPNLPFAKRLPNVLPLPAGEGRGEGERSLKPEDPKPMPLAAAPRLPANAVVVDFVLECACPLPGGAVAWWTGDSDGRERINGSSATAQGNAGCSSGGEVGVAFSVTGGYFEAPNSYLYSLARGDFTIELWVRFNSALDNSGTDNVPEAVFAANDEGTGHVNKWIFGRFDGRLGLLVDSPTFGAPKFFHDTTPDYFATGVWYHLAVVREGEIVAFYVNGICTWGYASYFEGPYVGASITMGQAEGIGGFDGCLDEVTIYNRALGQSEIQDIHNAGGAGKAFGQCVPVAPAYAGLTGIVGWWPAQGNARDAAGGNDATLCGNATYDAGEVGQAFKLDGYSWVQTPPSDASSFGTSDFTIELWVNFSDLQDSGCGSVPDAVFVAGTDPTYSPAWVFGRFNGLLCFLTCGYHYLVQAPYDFDLNTWYHLAVVRSDTYIGIYVNGVEVGSDTINDAVTGANTWLTMGGFGDTGYLNGLLDEVTIYNTASYYELGDIYSAGRLGKCNPDLDGNGIPDDWENYWFGHNGLDPNAPCYSYYSGLSNLLEYLLGGNPQVEPTRGNPSNISLEVFTPPGQ